MTGWRIGGNLNEDDAAVSEQPEIASTILTGVFLAEVPGTFRYPQDGITSNVVDEIVEIDFSARPLGTGLARSE